MGLTTVFGTSQKIEPAGSPFTAGSAVNGLSVDGVSGQIVLGNDVLGVSAILLSNREIPMGNFRIDFTNAGSTLRINQDNTASLEISRLNDEPFKLTGRAVSLGFPVPTIAPSAGTSVIAFDLMPAGVPADTVNGVAWFDVCNKGIIANNALAVNAARFGIFSNKVEIGSKAFNGATDIPVQFSIGNYSIAELRTTGTFLSGVADANFFTNRFRVEKNTANGFTGAFVFNSDSGNSSSLIFLGKNDFATLKFGFLRFENDAVIGDPYQNPLQLELLANSGATNGLVLGTLRTGTVIKFINHNAGIIETARFSGNKNLLIGYTVESASLPRLQVNGAIEFKHAALPGTVGTSFTDNAGAQAATLLNAPLAGNPTKWVSINDNGVTRFIPCW